MKVMGEQSDLALLKLFKGKVTTGRAITLIYI